MVLNMLSSLGPLEGCKSSSSFCICWVPWFVGIVFTGVVTQFAEVSIMFEESSSSVRNCSSKPSSSTNTMGGTPDVFVAFVPSVHLLWLPQMLCSPHFSPVVWHLPALSQSALGRVGYSRTVCPSVVIAFGCFLFVFLSLPFLTYFSEY